MLSLGSFVIGAILLMGLFVYDVFWVFGTEVRVRVRVKVRVRVRVKVRVRVSVFWVFGTEVRPGAREARRSSTLVSR